MVGDVAEPLGRRERVRAATIQEIKDTARRTLAEDGVEGLSLRAIGRAMGMTAPGLYRYFSSREDLVIALIADFYQELNDQLEAILQGWPAEEVTSRLLAACREFRLWSLRHRAEFSLLFGSPLPELAEQKQHHRDGIGNANAAHEAGMRFAGIFGTLVTQLYLARPFPVPADDEIDPRLLPQLRDWCGTWPMPVPLGLGQIFLTCWIQLYGMVSMEMFGHLDFALVDPEPMFEAVLRSLADLLRVADSYRRPADPSPPAGGSDLPRPDGPPPA